MQETLLASIRTDPQDDDARRVYADYLCEQGDPFGEFIKLQCDLESESCARARIRAEALLRKHGKAWRAPLRSAKDCEFRRGFIESLRMSKGSWLANLQGLMRSNHAVLAKLDFSGKVHEKDMVQLASSGCLANIRTIDLGHCRMPDSAMSPLVNCESLANLEVLDMWGNHFTDEGAVELARSRVFKRLRWLSLTNNPFGDRGLSALLKSDVVAGLKVLKLRWNRFSDYTIVALAHSERLANLQELDLELRHNHLMAEEAAMALCTQLPALRRLSVDVRLHSAIEAICSDRKIVLTSSEEEEL